MVVLVGVRLRLAGLEVGVLAALLALVSWTLLSAIWSADPSQSVREAERALLYLVALAVVLALAREGAVGLLLGGVLLAAVGVSGVALVRYLFFSGHVLPDRFEGYLLYRPVGYANALGLLAAIGLLLAVGLAVHGQDGYLRVGCAAALVPLLTALCLTSSRGSWLALAAALVALLAFENERLRTLAVLVALAPGPLLALWLSWHAHLHDHTPRFQAHTAERLGLTIVLLTAVTAALAQPAFALANRVAGSRHGKAAVAALVALAVIGSCAALLLRAGNSGASFDLSRGDRSAYWHVGWQEWQAHPFLGGGAGTFAHYWQLQPTSNGAQDAHSLYLETLAELGLPGLALLLTALGIPLVAAFKARHHQLVPTALAAYLAYLIHAGLDWDWEMPIVTISALTCGAALLLAARGRSQAVITVQTRAWMLAPVAAVLSITVAELVANGSISY